MSRCQNCGEEERYAYPFPKCSCGKGKGRKAAGCPNCARLRAELAEKDKVIARLAEVLKWFLHHSGDCDCNLCTPAKAALAAAGNLGKEKP